MTSEQRAFIHAGVGGILQLYVCRVVAARVTMCVTALHCSGTTATSSTRSDRCTQLCADCMDAHPCGVCLAKDVTTLGVQNQLMNSRICNLEAQLNALLSDPARAASHNAYVTLSVVPLRGGTV